MAEGEARETELSRADLRGIFSRSGKEEQDFMRALVNSSDPRQAVVVAECLHYFPGASLVREEPQDVSYGRRQRLPRRSS